MVRKANRYVQIIESIFFKHYREDATEVSFERSDIVKSAGELGIKLPKNLGDVLYSFRYRASLPKSITDKAPEGSEWIIRPAGRAQYKFVLTTRANLIPSKMLVQTKILDATPGVIEKYALNDEQALLAKLRYNRLIDIFIGITCYSLQNHLRTTVPGIGQVEIDEVYIGIDKRGALYILPVQAKGGSDKMGSCKSSRILPHVPQNSPRSSAAQSPPSSRIREQSHCSSSNKRIMASASPLKNIIRW